MGETIHYRIQDDCNFNLSMTITILATHQDYSIYNQYVFALIFIPIIATIIIIFKVNQAVKPIITPQNYYY